MTNVQTQPNSLENRGFDLFLSLGLGVKTEQARQLVAQSLGGSVTPQTFYRWRSYLGLIKGRGAFYDSDEIQMLAKFGQLVQGGISYASAYQILYDLQEQEKNGTQAKAS